MSLIIDASVAIAWSLPDETSAFAVSVLERIRLEGATTPVLFKFETANVLHVAMRRGRITPQVRDRILRDYESLALTYDLDCLTSVWTAVPHLSEKHGLSAYDATYLEVATRRRAPLATLDRKLARAVEAEGISLFQPAP